MKIEVVSNAPQTSLGESPLWCKITQTLLYIDILGKKVHNYCPKTGETQTMQFEQSVGFAVPTSRSKKDQLIVLVGLENKIVELDLSVQHILRTVLHVPESIYIKGMRFNDGKCNPDGELFAGYMSTKWREGRRGYLYRVIQGVPANSSADGSAGMPKSVLKNVLPREGIHLPNGTAWLGNDTMFLIDSAENEVTRLLFAPIEGGLDSTAKRVTERKLIYKLPQQSIDLGYMLDGMTIDNKGKLWVALCGAGCVLRIDPATGQEVFRLHLDVKYPTSCTFGKYFESSVGCVMMLCVRRS